MVTPCASISLSPLHGHRRWQTARAHGVQVMAAAPRRRPRVLQNESNGRFVKPEQTDQLQVNRKDDARGTGPFRPRSGLGNTGEPVAFH